MKLSNNCGRFGWSGIPLKNQLKGLAIIYLNLELSHRLGKGKELAKNIKAYSSSKQQMEKTWEERMEYELLSGMRVLESFTYYWETKGPYP